MLCEHSFKPSLPATLPPPRALQNHCLWKKLEGEATRWLIYGDVGLLLPTLLDEADPPLALRHGQETQPKKTRDPA